MQLATRSFLAPVALSVALGSAAVVACGTDNGDPVGPSVDDAGTPVTKDGGGPAAESDAGSDAATPLPSGTESEPNDGKAETETNPMTVPGEMKAAIGTPNDRDIFTVGVSQGELWEWTITPTAELAPHLAVFDITPDNMNPSRVVFGDAGKVALLEHFVLRPGKFVAGVRDARNVPTETGKGGPGFGYTLRAVKKTLAPVAVSFPSTKSGRLAGPGALDFYSFTATKGTIFGIVVKAARKAQPSTLDSRLSLYNLTTKTPIITNDNAGTSTDSQVGGEIPENGEYLVVLENEGNNPADLSYELVFQTTQP